MNHPPGVVRPSDNPFASRRIDRLSYRFRGSDTDTLIEKLHRQGGRGAIIGPHGSGKTTLLDELAGHLEGEIVRVNLRSDTRRPLALAVAALPRPIRDHHVVFLDGAEQLGPWSWWRLSRRVRHAGTIVITSHRAGRLPTIHECSTDSELLENLVAELAPEGVGAVDFEGLFHSHNGNIRLCFRELYDWSAGTGSCMDGAADADAGPVAAPDR